MPKTYTSATQRLLGLPAVFSGRDLTAKFQWNSATASIYLAQWRRAALVRSLGGHSDVHMNLLVQREANLDAALHRAYREAVRTGADVLRAAGWTTQIMRRPEVAVHRIGPKYELPDFTLSPRAPSWFARVAPGVERAGQGIGSLRPAWALADMLARALDRRVKQSWLLAPDDLDLEAARSDPEMKLALAEFALPADFLSDQGYAELYDQRVV